MVKNHVGCFPLRWFALAGGVLGASVTAGPGALGQASNGAWGPTPSPVHQTQSDLAAAGVAVPGLPLSASEAEQPMAPPLEAVLPLPQGPVDLSGVIGAVPAPAAPSDPAAAGVMAR